MKDEVKQGFQTANNYENLSIFTYIYKYLLFFKNIGCFHRSGLAECSPPQGG
jgi:hypothetical protein